MSMKAIGSWLFLFHLLIFIILNDVAGSSYSATVYIQNVSSSQNEEVTTPIIIDTNATMGIGSATIKLHYDPSVVIVTGVGNGELGSVTYNIDNTNGVVTMTAAIATSPGPTGVVYFAYIKLKAVGNAHDSCNLHLEVVSLYDGASSNPQPIDHTTIQDGIFTINGVPLTANANGPYSGYAGNSIQFHGSASGGNPPYSWRWDFGDGNVATEQNPTHVYASEGTYTVTLNVTDSLGNYAIDTTTVEIILNESIEPILEVSSLSHDFGELSLGRSVEWEIYIRNGGGGTLIWRINENISWMYVSPFSGEILANETDRVVVYVDTTNLEENEEYNGSFYIISNGGNKTVSINFRTINAKKYIEIIYPESQNLYRGATYKVRWKASGINDVEIYLCNGGVYKLGEEEASNNEFVWSIPDNLQDGMYRLKIQAKEDPNIFAYSDYFTITNIIEFLHQQETTYEGKKFDIRWDYWADDPVRIELYKDGELVRRVALNVSGGEYTWKVPYGLKSGEYTLKIISLRDPAIYDTMDIEIKRSIAGLLASNLPKIGALLILIVVAAPVYIGFKKNKEKYLKEKEKILTRIRKLTSGKHAK